jgi:hypothetical protein
LATDFLVAAFFATGLLAIDLLATDFLATDFLATAFLVAAFLASGFLATGGLATDFLAADFPAAGFVAAVLVTPVPADRPDNPTALGVAFPLAGAAAPRGDSLLRAGLASLPAVLRVDVAAVLRVAVPVFGLLRMAIDTISAAVFRRAIR